MRRPDTIYARAPVRIWSGAARLLGRGRGLAETAGFAPLLDARAASRLLGVPHTWLLAQARAGRIPHHRLGHYVRFNPEDLRDWLHDNAIASTRTDPRRGA